MNPDIISDSNTGKNFVNTKVNSTISTNVATPDDTANLLTEIKRSLNPF